MLLEEDIPWLWQQWHDKYYDIVNGTKEELPNINLINESKQYLYFMPQGPWSL